MSDTWRERAAPIIERVLAETARCTPRERRAALREAYPFGPKEYWPYKVWLSEIKAQTQGRPTRARRAIDHDTHTPSLFA